MEKVSLFKKIKLYRQYVKALKKNKEKLMSSKLNLRIDRVHRLYTVINMPEDVKTYGTNLTEKYIKEYVQKVDPIFSEMGLGELIGILKMDKIDETNYLIVFGFSLMDTPKFWGWLYGILTAILITGSILLF
jgi:hypothetical protein